MNHFYMKHSTYFTLFFFFSSVVITNLFAQNAVIAGKVVDKTNGETLIGVSIRAVGTDGTVKGAITDFDGNYLFEAPVGTYNITAMYTSYQTQTIEKYAAKAGPVNTLDFGMSSDVTSISEVVIVATTVRNTDASLIAIQRRAFGIQDGISSQQISRTGVSNAADAMKQVTGAVVEGGKFIVMRGLGDRYSITQLNGITMPSTDPYRNSSSLDLIPAQMIDNMVTIKTFTPDQPGNFSGGLVNITTKSFPDKFNLYFSASTSFNTQATGNDNFQGHGSDAGKYDWLGFDDGGRALPTILTDERNRSLLGQNMYLDVRNPRNTELRNLANATSRQLSNTFTTTPKTAPLNHGFNFSLGNNHRLGNNTLGYTFGLNYSREFNHYENGAVNTLINNGGNTLFAYQALNETKSTETPHLGGLANIAYKIGNNNSVSFNAIYNNDTDIVGRAQDGSWLGQLSTSGATYYTNSLEFIRRQYVSYQLSGRHLLPKLNETEIKWGASLNNSRQDEPDSRFFGYIRFIDDNNDEVFAINDAEFRPPFHFFRELEDRSQEFRLDVTIPLGSPTSGNQIKVGGLLNMMDRNFSEYQFQHNRHGDIPANRTFNMFKGDFNRFFDYSNFGVIDSVSEAGTGNVSRYRLGYHYINQVNNKNFYEGEQNIGAAYVMGVYNVLPKLKLVGGLRLETTQMEVISREATIAPAKIDLADLLYSANVIYALNEKSNLRLAATRTLARPNMRELSPFEQFDTKNGFFNIGNPNLRRTLIDNYDLRYELYPNLGELIAVSLFYKNFSDPILRRFQPSATIPELGYVNIDQARVFGVELEVRKNLGFIAEPLQDFSLSSNIAFIQSVYDIPADELQNSRNVDRRYDLTTRPFQSQAPYIVNAGLTYANADNGWESTLSFNVSGRRLFNIALAATPDMYEEEFPLLNFNVTKRFAQRYQVTVSARNLLDPVNRRTQDFLGETVTAESFRLGRTFGLSFAYFIR